MCGYMLHCCSLVLMRTHSYPSGHHPCYRVHIALGAAVARSSCHSSNNAERDAQRQTAANAMEVK